jgi:hypothetical protein
MARLTSPAWFCVEHDMSYAILLSPPQLLICSPNLFADDVTVSIYHLESAQFQNSSNEAFAILNKWFIAGELSRL